MALKKLLNMRQHYRVHNADHVDGRVWNEWRSWVIRGEVWLVGPTLAGVNLSWKEIQEVKASYVSPSEMAR